MKAGRATLAMALAWSLALTACRTNGVHETRAPIPLMSRCDGDPALESRLELVDPRTVQAGSRRSAEFGLRNASSRPLHVYYCVDWFDVRGTPLDSTPQLWYPADLGPREIVLVRAQASDARARSFRLIAQRSEELAQRASGRSPTN